ncbi:DUF3742 family protein [Cupriavidus pauculus]|uniref:DUF3742 family protein n=1 Tax=Cupriavidus pauculus TaxID=82633 RepID=UPI0007803A61|nr:DUF3742 family protein [Cupriavidus pauculus]
MKPSAQTTFAERAGRALGRMWWGCVRLDRKANGWLVAQGWAPSLAKAALLVIKLVALGLLFYAAFSLALLTTFAVITAWIARNSNGDNEETTRTEWRYGPAGYGLYTSNEQRIDPHDPEDDQP